MSRAVALQQTRADADGNTQVDRVSQRRARVAEWIPRVLAPAEGPDELGRLGGYRVLGVLGMGGMGVVFQAEDLALKRLVALKVMNPESSSDQTQARFLREAQAMAAVHHDHVVTIFQVGEDRGVPFLAMPLLEGQSLADRLREVKKLSVGEALRIVHEAAQGLAAAANAKGLTHRDIKPDNIWLEGIGVRGWGLGEGKSLTPNPQPLTPTRVKILDFGLARAADDEQHLTQSGAIVGTPNYLSPEQAQGLEVDARTDQFSLGIVLYEMLSGDKPFARNTLMATLRSIGSDAPRELDASIPTEVAALVRRLLEKRPEDRFATTADAISAIEGCQLASKEREGEAPAEPRTVEKRASEKHGSALASPSRTKIRRKWIALAAAAMVLMLGVIVTVRDKKGNIIARLFAPDGATVSVEPGQREVVVEATVGDSSATNPPPVIPSGATEAVSEQHLPAMSPLALVRRPAKLVAKEGEPMLSWTIATVPMLVTERNYQVSLRPDGQQLAVFGDDGLVRLWDVETKRLVQVLVGHAAGPAPAYGPTSGQWPRTNSRRFGPIAWHSKGSLLATASRDGSVDKCCSSSRGSPVTST